MYRVSIWLKGGGKIVEECDQDINWSWPGEILKEVKFNLSNNSSGYLELHRSPNDHLPIIIANREIAAIQIDENKKKEYLGRKLETRE